MSKSHHNGSAVEQKKGRHDLLARSAKTSAKSTCFSSKITILAVIYPELKIGKAAFPSEGFGPGWREWSVTDNRSRW